MNEIVEADLANERHAAALVHLLNAYACDPMGGGNQEVSTATGRVADFEVEDGFFGVRFGRGFGEHWLQGRVDQAVDQAGLQPATSRRVKP